jgi:hypothetical protein
MHLFLLRKLTFSRRRPLSQMQARCYLPSPCLSLHFISRPRVIALDHLRYLRDPTHVYFLTLQCIMYAAVDTWLAFLVEGMSLTHLQNV